MTGRLQKVVAPLLESARRLWATDKGDATGAISADVTKKSRSNFEPRPGAGTVLKVIEDADIVAGRGNLAEFESVGCCRPFEWLVCC